MYWIGALEMEPFGFGCDVKMGDGGEHLGIESFGSVAVPLCAVSILQ